MPGFVEMGLAAEEDDAMAQQGIRIAATVEAGRSPDSRTPRISAPIAGVIGHTSRVDSLVR
jgi:hypothetical protein